MVRPVVVKTYRPNATAVIYYSGHGWLDKSSGRYYLIPYDIKDRSKLSLYALQAQDFTDLVAEVKSQRLLAILDSDAKIPYVSKRGPYYYNFWRDARNKRGLWRRTTLEEYRKDSPAWEAVLDLDALAAAEGENWVWQGSSFLRPTFDRCLLWLSRGGG